MPVDVPEPMPVSPGRTIPTNFDGPAFSVPFHSDVDHSDVSIVPAMPVTDVHIHPLWSYGIVPFLAIVVSPCFRTLP